MRIPYASVSYSNPLLLTPQAPNRMLQSPTYVCYMLLPLEPLPHIFPLPASGQHHPSPSKYHRSQLSQLYPSSSRTRGGGVIVLCPCSYTSQNQKLAVDVLLCCNCFNFPDLSSPAPASVSRKPNRPQPHTPPRPHRPPPTRLRSHPTPTHAADPTPR